MVELLADFPPYVAAYKASGHVNHQEYERVVMRSVDDVARRFGSMNFLVRLETDMENYSLLALIDYLKISFKHIHRWNRMAIVSDETKVRLFYDALSPLVPGEIIAFPLKDFEKAKAWVSKPFLKDKNSLQRLDGKALLFAGLVGTAAMALFGLLLVRNRKTSRRVQPRANYAELRRSGVALQPESSSRYD